MRTIPHVGGQQPDRLLPSLLRTIRTHGRDPAPVAPGFRPGRVTLRAPASPKTATTAGNDEPPETALAAWRTTDPDRIDDATLQRIADLVAGTLSVAHPLWPAARKGDDAAAVRLAFDLLEADASGHCLDVAVSPLLALARAGNGAARLVLAHAALKSRPRRV